MCMCVWRFEGQQLEEGQKVACGGPHSCGVSSVGGQGARCVGVSVSVCRH